MNVRVSVVVPNLDGASLLPHCLAALERQRFEDFEVVVVDNGSRDGSVELVRGRLPSARVVELGHNRGFAGGANAGAAAAAGRYLAFLNNDAEPRTDWLAELVACRERHRRAASVASKILRRDDPSVIDGAGDAMTRSLKAYRRGAGEPDGAPFDLDAQVFSASGTACLWDAAIFDSLGGFDESYFAYYEDVDLGFRARLAGYECWYAPRAVVIHVGAATARHVEGLDHRYSVRNRWATVIKDAPGEWLVRNAHLVALGELLSWSRIAAAGDVRLLARELGRVVVGLPGLLRRRSETQRARTVSYAELASAAPEPFPPRRRSI